MGCAHNLAALFNNSGNGHSRMALLSNMMFEAGQNRYYTFYIQNALAPCVIVRWHLVLLLFLLCVSSFCCCCCCCTRVKFAFLPFSVHLVHALFRFLAAMAVVAAVTAMTNKTQRTQ